jgi:hypothetical protein
MKKNNSNATILKKQRAAKAHTTFIQNDFQKPQNSYDDVTSLFPNDFVPPFMLEGYDLINNDSLHIKNVMDQLYKVLRIPVSYITTLDTLYALIINNHLITSFTAKDKTKLIRKAYSCILKYILIIRFSHIIKNLLPKSTLEINKLNSNIVSIFTEKNNIHDFFQIELPEYKPEVALCFKNTLASLVSCIGQSYKALNEIALLFKHNNIDPNILSFENYSQQFWYSDPITF